MASRVLPRWAGVVGWAVLYPVIYGLVPVAISRRGRRYGWRHGKPGALNLIGVIPLTAGVGTIAWTAALHYEDAAGGWAIGGKSLGQPPEYLLTRGPYAYARNPMHVGTGAVWLGWSAILGSPALGAALAAGAAAVGVLVPRWEEVELERRFGDDWRAYRDAVPRWVPRLP